MKNLIHTLLPQSTTTTVTPPWPTTATALASQNDRLWQPTVGATLAADVDSTNVIQTDVNMADYFGFNYAGQGQQFNNGDSFDGATSSFKPAWATDFQNSFQGGAVRWFGGLHGNRGIMSVLTQPYASRDTLQSWYGAVNVPRFGYDEWLAWCASLGYPPIEWVINLMSVDRTDYNNIATPAQLVADAQLFLDRIVVDYPADRLVGRGQLSNEIDREHWPAHTNLPMSAADIAVRANAVIDAIEATIGTTQFTYGIFTQSHTLNYPNTANPSLDSQTHKAALQAAIPRATEMHVFGYTSAPMINANYNAPFGYNSANPEDRGYTPAWVMDKLVDQKTHWRNNAPGSQPTQRICEAGGRITDLNGEADNIVQEMTNWQRALSFHELIIYAMQYPWCASITWHSIAARWWAVYNGLESGQRINTAVAVDALLPYIESFAMVRNLLRGDVLATANTTIATTTTDRDYEGYQHAAVFMHHPIEDVYYGYAMHRGDAGQNLAFTIPELANRDVRVEFQRCNTDGDSEAFNVDINKTFAWTLQGADPQAVPASGLLTRYMLRKSVTVWRVTPV